MPFCCVECVYEWPTLLSALFARWFTSNYFLNYISFHCKSVFFPLQNWTELSAALLHVFGLHATVEYAFINTADLFTSFSPASLQLPLLFSNQPSSSMWRPSDQVPTGWRPLTHWVHWTWSNPSSTRLKCRVGSDDGSVKVGAAVTDWPLIMLNNRGRVQSKHRSIWSPWRRWSTTRTPDVCDNAPGSDKHTLPEPGFTLGTRTHTDTSTGSHARLHLPNSFWVGKTSLTRVGLGDASFMIKIH